MTGRLVVASEVQKVEEEELDVEDWRQFNII